MTAVMRMDSRLVGEVEMGASSALASTVVARMETICAVCPDFLLATVLEGMMRKELECLSQSDLEDLASIVSAHSPRNVAGFRLGHKVVLGCRRDGVTSFFDALSKMTAAEIRDWRQAVSAVTTATTTTTAATFSQ
ncbi:Hypothetical protein SCF082_LOCUS6971 [Durusdinium trenchii]|uniref:Uncharacterized protein n=1 Tax=Durusdinium trenchii TaxID=1381693 RepID=A0ABP0IG17_9DINO